MKKTFFAVFLAALSFSCASLLPIPQESDLAYASYTRQKPVQLQDLQMGRKLYMIHCAACHILHMPSELSPSGWGDMMTRMQPKAKIDDETRETILLYLTAMAGK